MVKFAVTFATTLILVFVAAANFAEGVSVPPQDYVSPPDVRLEYTYRIEIFQGSDTFDAVVFVHSAMANLLAIIGPGGGWQMSERSRGCYPWYRIWMNQHCSKTTGVVKASPLNQKEANMLSTLAEDYVKLFEQLNRDNKDWFELAWIDTPRFPFDLVTYWYEITAERNDNQSNIDKAMALVENYLDSQLKNARISIGIDVADATWCDDAFTCLAVHHESYTGHFECQPLVTEVVQHSIESLNNRSHWFNVVYTTTITAME